MFKTLTPIFAFIIAIGLVLTYVRPTFQSVRDTQDETKEYESAIARAQELRTELQRKIDQKKSFTPSQLERLEAMIPDSADEVATILDIDTLARAHNMSVSGIAVAGSSASSDSSNMNVSPDDLAMGGVPAENTTQSTQEYSSKEISFTLAGTYEDLRAFIDALEKSLVLYDVTKLEFGASDGDVLALSMTIRTYMFNSGN